MSTLIATADRLISLVGDTFGPGFIPLHRPVFEGNEKQFLIDCIDSNFVSSVGARVTEFENQIAEFTGSRFAIATVNGTAALHAALIVAGVERDCEVLGQAVTFIATFNAVSYIGAKPVFIDVDEDTMGMSPTALRKWLETNAEMRSGQAFNRQTGARLAACVPMHTFGMPLRIVEIAEICEEFGIPLVEDTAESLGSYVGTRHTGTFGKLGTYSFNGNKIITTGGGGMIVTDDEALAKRAKYLTTTAKVPHAWDFFHDETGYNYRLPNLNAALGCAQMEKLGAMLAIKAEIASQYRTFCAAEGLRFFDAREGVTPNWWLNAILLSDRQERDEFLAHTNARNTMTRPIWTLMSELPMFADCQNDGLAVSKWLADRVVNLPSSVPDRDFHRISN